jgi:translation initiation factor IF-1
MPKEEMLEMDGTVLEVLPNTNFRVELENGASVLAYAGGRVRQHRIRILAGDRVRLEISPYDVTRGRINYRHKDENPVAMGQRRPVYRKKR